MPGQPGHPPKKFIGGVFRGAPSLQFPFPVAVPLSVEVELIPLVQRGANVDWSQRGRGGNMLGNIIRTMKN